MIRTVLACLVLSLPAVAAADSDPEAIRQERADGAAVQFYAQQTTIAEHDLADATAQVAITKQNWDAAVKAKHPNRAGKWAQRHAQAKEAERNARLRLDRFRVARDAARERFQGSAERVRATRSGG